MPILNVHFKGPISEKNFCFAEVYPLFSQKKEKASSAKAESPWRKGKYRKLAVNLAQSIAIFKPCK